VVSSIRQPAHTRKSRWDSRGVDGAGTSCAGLILLGILCTTSAGCRPSQPIEQDPIKLEVPTPEEQQSTQTLKAPQGWNWQARGMRTQPPSPDWPHLYQSGSADKQTTILESLGGGVGVIDFDLDGQADLFFTGGGRLTDQKVSGQPGQLFHNRGDWNFTAVGTPAAVDEAKHYSHGAFVSDYDEDGFPDILVTGYGGLTLFRNQGDGTFTSIPAEQSGLEDSSWSSAAAWGDFNQDGFLDLYVGHYVDWSFENHPICPSAQDPEVREICSPRQFQSLNDMVYLSNGDGTFREATAQANLKPGGKCLGVVSLDIDRDGDCDLYVANDTTNNFLYLNDGQGRFEEVGELSGVALDDHGIPNGSMGVDAGDFNQDGQFDLWVANYESEAFALYRQSRDALFTFVSHVQGIRAIESEFVGFGTLFTDADLDGDEDLFVTNGHVILHPTLAPRKQLPLVLENTGTQFNRLQWPSSHELGQPHEGRGLAQADLDRDGDPDLIYAHVDEAPLVLENEVEREGSPLVIRLIGTKGPRTAIGAVVEVETDQATCVRTIKGGGSYLSTSENVLFFGIPDGEQAKRIRVQWGSGEETQLDPTTLDTEIIIVEPSTGSR
jgi:hypothetical protein